MKIHLQKYYIYSIINLIFLFIQSLNVGVFFMWSFLLSASKFILDLVIFLTQHMMVLSFNLLLFIRFVPRIRRSFTPRTLQPLRPALNGSQILLRWFTVHTWAFHTPPVHFVGYLSIPYFRFSVTRFPVLFHVAHLSSD